MSARASLMLLIPYVVLLQSCGAPQQTPQPASPSATAQPSPVLPATAIDAKGLWKPEYATTEERALANHDVELLSKFADIHYNTAIAALNEKDLLTHVQRGELIAGAAVAAYRAKKLPTDSWDYANLLYRLAVFEEKGGKFAEAERDMKACLDVKVAPPPSKQQLFTTKMDLARIYIMGRNDKAAAKLTDELLAEYRKDSSVTDAQLVLFDTWIKAQERVDAHLEQVEKLRTLSKRMKMRRAGELEKQATDALNQEKERDTH